MKGAPGIQRQVAELVPADKAGQNAVFGVDSRGGGSDLDGLAAAAYLKLDIEAADLLGRKGYFTAPGRLEAFGRHVDRIHAGRNAGELILASVVGGGPTHIRGAGFRQDHLGARNNGLACIDNGPSDRTQEGLRPSWPSEQ
jgi:hypothetical protein